MSLRAIKKDLLIPDMGRRAVKALSLKDWKFISDAGASCKRFKTRRLKDLRNTKARAKRKAKQNG